MKKLFLILFFIPAVASASECVKGDCKNGYGIIVDSKDTQYTGQFKDGHFHGMGTLVTPEGVYTGSFKDGLFHGKGVLATHKGDMYKGNFQNGLFHGRGTLITEDCMMFTGYFKEGLFSQVENNSSGYKKLISGISH